MSHRCFSRLLAHWFFSEELNDALEGKSSYRNATVTTLKNSRAILLILNKINEEFLEIECGMRRSQTTARHVQTPIQTEKAHIENKFKLYRKQIWLTHFALVSFGLGLISTFLFLLNETFSFIGKNFPNRTMISVSVSLWLACPLLAIAAAYFLQKKCCSSKGRSSQHSLSPYKLIQITALSIVFNHICAEARKLDLERVVTSGSSFPMSLFGHPSARQPQLLQGLTVDLLNFENDGDYNSSSDEENQSHDFGLRNAAGTGET